MAMIVWEHLKTGRAGAEQNMQTDREILSQLRSDTNPILRTYDWEGPSATYGYFIHPLGLIQGIKKLTGGIARRPTGGGIILHGWDFAYSVFLPANHPSFTQNTLKNYAFVNLTIIEAVRKFIGKNPVLLSKEPEHLDNKCASFCMAKPTIYDIMIDGKKTGGGAQRRTKDGFIHQGSIALILPPEELLHAFFEDEVIEAMKKHTHPLLSSEASLQTLSEAKKELADLIFCALKR